VKTTLTKRLDASVRIGSILIFRDPVLACGWGGMIINQSISRRSKSIYNRIEVLNFSGHSYHFEYSIDKNFRDADRTTNVLDVIF
jgi:hypothetical protein